MSRTCNARGRLTQESKVIAGTGGGTFVTQWSYDAMDRVVWMKYPANNTDGIGERVDYTYTTQGLLDTAIGTSTYVKGTSYNALGQVEQRGLGLSGSSAVLTTDYIYRTDNFRLQWIKTGPSSLYALGYTYDTAVSGQYNTGHLVKVEQAGVFARHLNNPVRYAVAPVDVEHTIAPAYTKWGYNTQNITPSLPWGAICRNGGMVWRLSFHLEARPSSSARTSRLSSLASGSTQAGARSWAPRWRPVIFRVCVPTRWRS